MGSFLLAILVFGLQVNHVFPVEELNNEFTYHNVDLGTNATKYGNIMFCFTLNECSNNFNHSLCLIETDAILGCVSDAEDSTTVTYMYPVNQTHEHCIIYNKEVSWSHEIKVLLNIWQGDTLIIQVRP